jgi:hypothetical protein
MRNKFLKKCERTVVKILCVIVNFGFLNLFLDIWIWNPDSGYRTKLNADPTGSGSETLPVGYERLVIVTAGNAPSIVFFLGHFL